MIELKLVKKLRGASRGEDNLTFYTYELGEYVVKVRHYEYSDGTEQDYIDTKYDRNLPEIYAETELDGTITGFTIQTTSYGAVEPKEVEKLIARYQKAIEAVKVLEEKFIEK